jgi:molybdenum cofactor sulfurtransferase
LAIPTLRVRGLTCSVIISPLTHPDHSSKLSAALTATARAAVLSFFNAPPGSTVIFTANASAALKLVGEAFPFTPEAAFILPEDAHNSVHGIREFARAKGAPIVYLSSPPRGGVRVREALVSPMLVMTHIPPFDTHISTAQTLIDKHRPRSGTPALFAYTGQSNITSSKPPLAVLAHAAGRGFTTLLDAAALAPTTPIDLTNTPVDAVAVSFYKMFGFPTGIGALILAPGIGAWLREKRPWFAGGTVEVVQVPGTAVGRTAAIDEAFEVSVTLCVELMRLPERNLGWHAQLHASSCGDDWPPSPRRISPCATGPHRCAVRFVRTPP